MPEPRSGHPRAGASASRRAPQDGAAGSSHPVSDPARLEALRRTGLLQEETSGEFERVLRLAQKGLDASAAAFLVVSSAGFHCRGALGLPEAWTRETVWPLDWPLLLEAAFQGAATSDGSSPSRAAASAELPGGNPFPGFAGLSIRDPQGARLGVLAVWSTRPRDWSRRDLEVLAELAGEVEERVALRLEAHRPRRGAPVGEPPGHRQAYLEAAEALSRAAESEADAEKALPAALEALAGLLAGSRALLVHPADPEAPEFRVPFASSRAAGSAPEAPAAEIRIARETPLRDLVRAVLEAPGPRAFGPGDTLPSPRWWREAFGAGSVLALAVRPRAGRPWLLSLLRAPGAAPWTAAEIRLFGGLAGRVTSALGGALLHRDLRRSEEKYRTLFERSLDGVFRCGPDGTVLDANPALVSLLGCRDRGELVGRRQPQLLPAGGDLRGLSDAREPFTVRLARSDGAAVWAEVGAQAVRRSDGAVAWFEGVVRNIDDRKRAEQALKENEDALRQAQKMEAVGRLAGGVAHDFNNLLTAINGFSDLLLMQVSRDDPRRLHAEEIRKAGERAAALTGQLLAFSRKQVLAPRNLDINAVVAGMEPMLRRLIGENIAFEVIAGLDLPDVLADPSQAEQIILNLALNARDAMPTGGRLRVATAARRYRAKAGAALLEVPEGDYVELTVADTGVGMDEETKARLFEPFFTTKGKDKGTGLGLSMVYGAVKQAGGTLELETRKGLGTTFRVLLPAAGRGARAAAPVRPTGRMPAGVRGTETILLVEDEDAVRRLVRDVLQVGGYTVLEAPAGERALEVAAAHEGRIHLLLTDVVMGGMSGRELAERLRALRPDTRVLFMSGYTEDAIIRHGVLSSQTAFIGKPFTPAALAGKVREVLSGSGVAQGG